MSVQSNNATCPSPAIAPGADGIDAGAVARYHTIDSRIPTLIPGFDAPFFQAGLAGYSDAPMRLIARAHGCPFCVTEALLDRTLLAGGRGFAKADLGDIAHNIPGGADDAPLAGQIMGSDPDDMAMAAVKMIEQAARPPSVYRRFALDDLRARHEIQPPATGSFAAIDVNLACPVKKIRRKARGGHWLCEPEGAIDILRAVRDAVPRSIPVTVKMRRGSDDSPQAQRDFLRLFEAAYDVGCAWVTVHARTVAQKYVGPSQWPFLRDLVERYPDRVIFGSGDIWSASDIFRMIDYTGVHAVSVARGCIGNPWIFRQARQLMAGRRPTLPTIAEQRQVLTRHFHLAIANTSEQLASRTMRKFAIRFSAHHDCADDVRRRFIAVHSLDEWRSVLDDYYQDNAKSPLPVRDPALTHPYA